MKYLYQNKHWQINKDYNLDKLLYLIIDRPNKIHYSGSLMWRNNKNQDHRNYDLPSLAAYCDNGTYNLYWFKNDK